MSFSSVIPQDRIIARLRYENPWWVNGKIDETYQEMSRRLYFKLFFPHVLEKDINRALVLMGPRRVGKTVLLFHTVDELLQSKVNPENICFVGIDNPIYINLGLEDILDLYKEALKRKDLEGC